MQLRVLGCSGSIASGRHTSTFLVSPHILIDAGTGVGDLSVDEMLAINHIFVSHAHLDHIVSIGFLADTVLRKRQLLGLPPIQVHGLSCTLDALRTHILNNIIWPDFSVLPCKDKPTLSFHPLSEGDVQIIDECRIEALPARHSVPAVGYAIANKKHPKRVWAYSGDTGPNPALWQRLNQLEVTGLIIETAFSDEEADLARISGHHCPSTLLEGLAHLQQPTTIYLTHLKPGEYDSVIQSLQALCPALADQPTPDHILASVPCATPARGSHTIYALKQGQVLL